ncbi:class I SAM-dependent methyltransferase [Paenibacillus sp. MBLB4367]|uniref:class I SAM-dependent methyltransferase n=1 Tax=Paenibacillus sp. MBLB4367 TaxID=3384767 RepID=UPI0039080E9D
MPSHEEIYARHAEGYEKLIDGADCEGNILAQLQDICPAEGLDVVDLGAGTGRFARLLAPVAKSVTAVDRSPAMLAVTEARLRASGLNNWRTVTGDHRSLPLPDRSADLIVSGWSVCYIANSDVSGWRDHLAQTIAEIKRVLRPNGTIVLFETLGTGTETPQAPDILRGYYDALKREYGFSHTWIRTDYQFEDGKEAEELTRFFFGNALADRVAAGEFRKAGFVPEWAGVWWLRMWA